MRVVIQRVTHASVTINEEKISEIQQGILALVGIEKGDNEDNIIKMATKTANLRIFSDENGKMNLSLKDINGEMLIVSQFTLCGNCKKGTRPSFDNSASPQIANELYEKYVSEIQNLGIKTQTGKFGANMQVELLNDGPVTFILEN